MALTKVLSIEITDYSTKACEISYGKKLTTVYNTVEFVNPTRTVEDAFIVEHEAYVAEMKKNLNAAKMRCKDVVFVIASNKILSREVIIPDMKEKLIAGYIEGEKNQYFPMDVSEHRLSYCIVDKNADKKEMRLIVYAAPVALIRSYSMLAKELGFKIVRLDYSGNSEYQHLSVNNESSKVDFYLAINEANTMFTILENGKFSLQRNMNFGTLQLVQHLIDEGYYGDISFEEAANKLEMQSLLFPSYSEMMEYMPLDEADSNLYECKKRITDAIRPLIASLSRVLEYYNSKNKNATIGTIYVGGPGSRINGLLKLVMSEFEGLELVALNNLPGIKYSKSNQYMFARSTDFMACIGAGQLSVIDFKIVDVADEKKSSQSVALLLFLGAIIGAAALVGIPLLSYYGQVSKQKDLKKELASLAEYEKLLNDKNTKNAQYEELQTVKTLTETQNEHWNEILSNFEVLFPSNTRVTSLSSDETGVSFVATVPTKEEAAKLLVQLETMPVFTDISVNSIEESDDEQTGVKSHTFSVFCAFPVKEQPQTNTADQGTEGTTTDENASTDEAADTTEGGTN